MECVIVDKNPKSDCPNPGTNTKIAARRGPVARHGGHWRPKKYFLTKVRKK